MERTAAWWRRRDVHDILAVLFIVACIVLILINISMYPVFLDIPYHMAVTRGFQEAGGITTWDFWDYAPAGRPHIYPPLLHVGMSALQDIGLSAEATATFVCVIMFPLILLSLWWAMRKLFGSRAALYALILVGVPYAFFYQTGITIAASLVLFLTPLVFLALEKDRKIAAAVLLAMCLYSHLVLGHLVALALFIYMLHRWREWRKVMTVLASAYILYLPWGIVVLANLGSFSVSQPGVGGGFTLHLLLWGLAAAGAVVCYLHKKQYYLLPAYLLSMVPIAFFYSHRFWEGHVFLPLAMLGGVALDRLHAFLKERLSRRSSTASYARAMAVGSLVLILLLALFADPVIASTQNRPALVGQRAVGGYGTAPRIPGGAQPPAGYEGGVLTPRGQGYSSVPGVDTPGFPTGEGYVPSPPSGYSPARPRPGDTRPLNGLPSGGDGDAPALPLRALRDLNRDSVTLSMRPTTIPVLLGLEDSQPHMGSGQEVFGDETMELMEIITQNSEPTDIVFACDGRLGDLIYTMTGRYSTQGMFHEVQPESETDPLTEADLAVVPAGPTRLSGGSLPGGRGEPGGLDDWTLAGRAGTYAVYISESAEETEGGVSSAVLPLWVAYALLLACILAVIIDVARKRSGHGPPRGSSPTQPYGNPTGGGAQDSNTVIAVVPAHNEEENIAETVGEIRSVCPGLDVLVVDDGSTDSTGIEALNSGAMVIALEENLGVGEAERRGLYYAYSHGYGYAVRLDGDGQHPASAIADLLAALCGEEADVVVGSRFLRTAGGEYDVSRPRRWGIAYFRVLLRLSSRLHFTDPTSGFRAYSRRAMSLVCRSEPPRYPEVTSLRLFARNGLKVCEVPVLMRARMRGRSTLGAWRAVSLIAVATLDLMRPPFLLSPAGTRESALA